MKEVVQSPYQRSLEVLLQACTEDGFLASPEKVSNYNRVWSRDGVICGLAGLLSGDETLIEGMKATLETLANHQSSLGHIPSNVHILPDGKDAVSYGGMCGRGLIPGPGLSLACATMPFAWMPPNMQLHTNPT